MGKNRSASGITNVIQYDNNGNITFVSGSTTLMQVSSSGAITTTGVISGSNALSASFSLNSALLNGTGSVGFATTGSLLTVSSSQQQISASQQQLSSSFLILTASFNAVSASQQQISSSYIALSASYNTFSGSASTRITVDSASLLQVSSSQQQISSSLLNVISVFATTGSNSFRATQSITGSLTVTGQIIAQTLNVQQVTSSIIYSSGSNNFGCDLNSRQTFTGSVLITGSLTIAGASSAASYSGTTIYGSTAVCSPVGKFSTCLDLGGALTGTSATFSGAISVTIGGAGITLTGVVGNNLYYVVDQTPNSGKRWRFGHTGAIGGFSSFDIYNQTDNITALSIASTGAATFSSSVTAVGLSSTTSAAGNLNSLIRNSVTSASGTTGYGLAIESEASAATSYALTVRNLAGSTTYFLISTETGKIGYVGIGTTSPSYKLQVGDLANASAVYNDIFVTGDRVNNDGYYARLIFGNSSQSGGSTSSIRGERKSSNYATELTFYTNVGSSAGDGTERMRITSGGETRFQNSVILTNGQLNSLTSGGSGQSMYLNYQGNGAIYAGSSYTVLYAGSDRRIKTDIVNSQSTLNKILNLTPRTFKYKDRPEFTNYGFIAQEVEEIMPELVRTSEGITMCGEEEIENQKSIESYGLAWASILVKAVQEQQQQINELKQLINK